MTNTIDSSLMLSSYQKEQRKTGSDVLGKDDFLKILMVQLQNQDPMNPMQDKDFIAQMATFSTLEQITNMGKSMDKFVKVQEQSQLIAYNQFVGKDITWHKVSEAKEQGGTPVIEEGTGRVASVQFKDNNVLFILDDGTKLEPGNISQINETSKENAMVQASMMIGKSVTYLADKAEKTGLVKSVSFKDGKTLFQLDDETTTITASQITKIE
ncbi:flagellar hook assembly protein FlgD [Bacillus sp. DTU_2020_1000418_1_SI_GHA_SEK_038]|uniref:flagellar hook assembly protein FlgD n=1 Tax=Bacillus sp. DTU_2020_1000418_1_SI_GHA_SEK_038 TaxID=3077585 RepID=UPI0028EA106E|nr:flagellar hook assembly protein FlgD [Bacillus sp. DTU_2020_1000418_1_SI_GHA_SEK_038]WNS77178.1 flagellar hook assembly protein FlgD [Bacillus sp. DTU_2020_1000418_1_SI_GHA_SEK_038]